MGKYFIGMALGFSLVVTGSAIEYLYPWGKAFGEMEHPPVWQDTELQEGEVQPAFRLWGPKLQAGILNSGIFTGGLTDEKRLG